MLYSYGRDFGAAWLFALPGSTASGLPAETAHTADMAPQIFSELLAAGGALAGLTVLGLWIIGRRHVCSRRPLRAGQRGIAGSVAICRHLGCRLCGGVRGDGVARRLPVALSRHVAAVPLSGLRLHGGRGHRRCDPTQDRPARFCLPDLRHVGLRLRIPPDRKAGAPRFDARRVHCDWPPRFCWRAPFSSSAAGASCGSGC